MDFAALPHDGESFRARHSECLDVGVLRLAAALRAAEVNGGAEAEAEAGEILAALPSPVAARLAEVAARLPEWTRKRRAEAAERRAAAEAARRRLEGLREATERAATEAAGLSERISAANSENRREERLDAERRRERRREQQDIQRQIEKKELQLRRETMEHDRLSKMLNKVRK
ncbi:uncharacterized protein TM35_000015740 [Trypanosoma theileri]|uniref:Uncharacterized protein n=1 Tax=Trypanosoma theileri TaxID=67003 RepID=A0A1X0P9T8_9TRYP|nr:uncharacterized protein TM35_000015740 [Trypanosoma theileri]ORC93697.1 hypothetical protein TM35_000015740 [Trypanosoma theileri]